MRDRVANYEVIGATNGRILIRDLGPWDKYMTVTNAAQEVVEELVQSCVLHDGDRLFYFDSMGELDEIIVENLKFSGFRPGPKRTKGK